jgi:hypothetical protein
MSAAKVGTKAFSGSPTEVIVIFAGWGASLAATAPCSWRVNLYLYRVLVETDDHAILAYIPYLT